MNICADCRRFMGCSWERHFKPVVGWKAKECEYTYYDNGAQKRIVSYDVIDCPLFIPPGPHYRKPTKHQNKEAYRKGKPGVRIVGQNIRTGEKKVWDKMCLVIEDGFSPGRVSDCVNGRTKSHKGWVFSKGTSLTKGENE